MTYEEFYKELLFRRTYIIIPNLGNYVIDKTQFLTKEGFDIDAQEKELKKIYNENLEVLKTKK